MLPKNMADEDLKKEMLPFGAIEDCVVLRDRDGNSKGQHCFALSITSYIISIFKCDARFCESDGKLAKLQDLRFE